MLAAAAGPLLPNLIFSEDSASSPEDLCAVIPKATIELAVPMPKVTRSEASNDGPYTRYGYCDIETDHELATSNARGNLSVRLERHGTVGYSGPTQEARDSFARSKQYDVDEGDPVLDVPRLGDAAYAVIDEPDEYDKTQRSVHLEVLVGSDTIQISYFASPTNDGLVLAAAVAAARATIKGLAV